MPDEASDLGEFKQNLARPRRDAAVGRREKKNTHFSLSQALKVYSLLPLAGGAN